MCRLHAAQHLKRCAQPFERSLNPPCEAHNGGVECMLPHSNLHTIIYFLSRVPLHAGYYADGTNCYLEG